MHIVVASQVAEQYHLEEIECIKPFIGAILCDQLTNFLVGFFVFLFSQKTGDLTEVFASSVSARYPAKLSL